METFLSIEQVVQMSLNEAERKKNKNHLYRTGEDEKHDWNQGDPETIYSIASLFSQEANNPQEAENAIIEKLVEVYGEEYL